MASLEERREARRRRRAAGGDDESSSYSSRSGRLNIGGVTPDRSEVIDAVNERLARRRREREGRRIVELSTENAENGEGESDLERRRRERREARLRESAETPADEETTSRRSRRRESNDPSEEESASSRRRRAKEQEEEAESAPAEEEEQPAEEEDNTAAQEAAERRRRQEEEEEERKREEAAERKRQEQERIRQKQEEEEERRRQEEECAFFDMIYGCGDDKTSELSELDTKMIESYEYVTKNMKEKTMSRLVQNGSDVNSNMSDNSLCYQADSESHCQDTDTTDAGESEIFEYPKESRSLSHVRETYGSTCTSDCESYEENRREKRYTRKVKSPGVDPRATPINYYSDSDMTDTMEEDEDNDLAQTYTNAKFSEQVQYSGDEEINNERQRNGDGPETKSVFCSPSKENPTQNMISCVEKQQRKTSFDIKQNHKSNVGHLKNEDNGNIPLKEEQTTSFAVPRLDFGGGGSSKTSSSDSEGKNHHPLALGDGIGSRLKSVSNLLELDFGDEYEANQSQCLTDSSPSDAEPPFRKTSSSSIGSKLNSKMAAMYASFTADDRVELSPRRQMDNKPSVKPRKKSLATSSDSPCSSPRNGSGNLTPRKNGGYIPAVITDESIEAAKSCKYSPRKQMDKWKLPIPIPGMIKNTTQFVNSSKVTKVSDNLIKEEVKVLPKPRPLSADRGRTFIEMKEREEERKRLEELEKKNKMNKSVLDLIAQRQHFHSRRNDIGIPSPRDVPDSSKVSVRETLMSSGCELSSPRTSSPRISSLRSTKTENVVSPRGTPLKVHHASRFDDILKDVVSPRRSSLKDESGRNVGEIKGWREFQQEYNTKRRVSKIDFSSDSDCDRSEKSNLRKSDMEFLSPRNRDLRLNLSSVTGENSLLRKINSFQDRIHSIETANSKDSNSVISPRVRSSSHDGRVSHIKAKLLKSETGSPSHSLTFSPRGVGLSSISNVKGNNSNTDITSGSMDQSNLRANKLMRDNSASRKNRVFMSHDVLSTNNLDGVDSASNKRVDLKNIGRKLSQVNLDRVTLQLMSTVKNRLNKFESKINSPREEEARMEEDRLEEERQEKEEARRRKEEDMKKKGKRKGLGGLSPEKKKMLKKLIMQKAAEDLRNEAKKRAEEKDTYINERVEPLSIDGLSQRDLRLLVQKLQKHYEKLEEEVYDWEIKIREKETEINDLTVKVNDTKGKFMKPVLRKVNKTESKFAKLERKEHRDFRGNLKSTGQNKYKLEEEETSKTPDWRQTLKGKEEGEESAPAES